MHTLVTLCQDLLRFDTRNPGSSEEAAARYVCDTLAAAGQACEVLEPEPGRCSVISVHRGSDSGRPPLVVHGHLDVVPPQESGWTHDPFGGMLAEGMLWGRGAVDMKCFVGMMLAAELELAERSLALKRDVVFAYFADEEMGGAAGADWITHHRPEVFEGADEALGEGGGFTVTMADGRRLHPLNVAERGALCVTVAIPGPGGHAAFGNVAQNPVTRLARLVPTIADLRLDDEPPAAYVELLEELGRLRGCPSDGAELLDELGSFGQMAASAHTTTFVPTVVRAGEKINVVPDRAELSIDCRFVPGAGAAAHEALRSQLEPDMTYRIVAQTPGSVTTRRDGLTEVIRSVVKETDPDGIVVPFAMPGGTDGQLLAPLGIASYGFTPMTVPASFDFPAAFHAADEKLPVVAVTDGYETFRRILAAC